MKRILLLSFLLLSCTLSFGQSEEEMKIWQAYMTPSEVHLEWAKNDGIWDTENTMWMKPGAEPVVSKGTMDNKMILGGRYQQSTYKSMFNGMPMEGMSMLAFDNKTKEYTSTWVDNFGTGMMVLKGKQDTKTGIIHLTGTMTDIMSAEPMNVRETYTVVDKNTHKMEMFFEFEGKEYMSMRLIFKRRMK